jgi:hypothetical protein
MTGWPVPKTLFFEQAKNEGFATEKLARLVSS